MIEVLLVLIVVFEVIRLLVYLGDSRMARETNRKASEHQNKNEEFVQRQNAEWKSIRKAEIAELKNLALLSDTMKQIYDEWVEANK